MLDKKWLPKTETENVDTHYRLFPPLSNIFSRRVHTKEVMVVVGVDPSLLFMLMFQDEVSLA